MERESLTFDAIFEAPLDDDFMLGQPFQWAGFTVHSSSGIRHLLVDDVEIVRLQEGMLHQLIVVHLDDPDARRVLEANGITVDGPIIFQQKMNEYAPDEVAFEEVPPLAMWVKRMPGMFATESKLRLGWQQISPDEDDWSHALYQSKLVDP